jgi:hypothetical protein
LEDTVLYRSNLAPMAWFYAMLLLANSSIGMRSTFLRKQLGLGVRSTVRLGQHIRLQMAALEGFEPVGGPGKLVYVDEALATRVTAGLRTQRHRSPIVVMGFACDDRVVSGIIPDRTGTTIKAAIERCVRPGSILVTDAHASYAALRKRGWQHLIVNHSVAFHDFNGNTINAIETYWRVLKRTLSGYGLVDAKNAWLYLAEVQFRYNRRRSTVSLFDSLIERFPAIGLIERAQLERHFDWRLTQPFEVHR